MNYLLMNFNLINYLILIMMFSGISVFCSKRKHLLLTLLSLEYLVLVIFFMFFIFMLTYIMEGYFVLVFLTFSVCEGALGLGILVSLIRCHGNDNMMSLSSLMW
uniref:NADH dehydrogenase subunit 4L n=1 Tax=Sigara lateralis TaxID=537456 RepID=UPI00286B4344|nr:NADH dehydrogenase subunit 4L [Sigara lateralis]WKD80509.1 NADH dehydrogenase subunit 4L [Sigara lateralis]